MKKVISLLSLTLIMALVLSGCGGGSKKEANDTQSKPAQEPQQQVIKLKLAHFFPVGHSSYENAIYFIQRVEDLSKGKVKIEHYPAEQLGKLKDLLNLASQGIADMAFVPPSFYAGQVPLNTVMTLPFWTTAAEGSEIYNRLAKACPELTEEFLKYGVRPYSFTATSQYEVGTVRKPLNSPEDLKGLKLKTSGGLFDKIAVRYGIRPVTVASPEIYEATQRGITDGNILSYSSVKGYRVNELEKHRTLGLRMGGYPSVYVINEKRWQSLPDDVRKAILTAAADSNKEHTVRWDRETEELAAQFQKDGMTIYRIKPEERAHWEAPLKGIEEEWVQDMEKKGFPARKVCEEYLKICKEVAK